MASSVPSYANMLAQIGTVAARIAAIAARQHGVIHRDQLLEAGLSSSSISVWARSGHLHRLHRCAYAVGNPNVSREGRCLAAVLACAGVGVLSHSPAARVLGLDRSWAIGTIHVTVPLGCKRSPAGVLVHRTGSLLPQDVTRRSGIPLTTPTRTLFDLASTLRPRELRQHFERAEYLEVLDRPRLAVLLDGARGRRGLGELRGLMGHQPLPLGRTRSSLERIILRTCRDHGLPLPGVNVALLDYEVDFFWPQARFVVEADGGQHRGPQRDRDNARDVTLARAGHLVRRYSGEALTDERAVAAEILEILHERLGRLAI